MTSWIGRDIVYTEACEEKLRGLGIDFKRLDEARRGLDWALSNQPEYFPRIMPSSLRLARIHQAPGVPELTVWFTFDDERVTVVEVELGQFDESSPWRIG